METDREYERFAEGDKEIFACEFVTPDGRPIGSIVRFAAHAVTANRPGSFSSDYPYYVRRKIEEKFGGICMFLNGPCAEIAPSMLNKFEGRERTIGSSIADLVITSLSDKSYESLEKFFDSKFEIKLPARPEVIANDVDIPDEIPDNLPERRRYLEKKVLKSTLPFLREKYTEGELSLTDEISVFVGALTLGDITLVAFPGETFYKTGSKVKSSFPDKKLVTVTEHERTVMYLPPREDFLLGGYETTCKLTDIHAEEVLLEGAVNNLKKFFERS